MRQLLLVLAILKSNVLLNVWNEAYNAEPLWNDCAIPIEHSFTFALSHLSDLAGRTRIACGGGLWGKMLSTHSVYDGGRGVGF